MAMMFRNEIHLVEIRVRKKEVFTYTVPLAAVLEELIGKYSAKKPISESFHWRQFSKYTQDFSG